MLIQKKKYFYLFFVLLFLWYPSQIVHAKGIYFTGTGSLIPGRYSFSDSTGQSNVSSSFNLNVSALAKPTENSRLNIRAYSEKKTIISPYRESLLGITYSTKHENFFSRPLSWSGGFQLNAYDDKSSDPNDFKGFGVHINSFYPISEMLEFRSGYRLTQRDARDSSNGFWHHAFNLGNTYRFTRDISLISGMHYIRNNARDSQNDFLDKEFKTRYNHLLPWNHRSETSFSLRFIDYHNNRRLEKDTIKFDTSYIIPLAHSDHSFKLLWDIRKFPDIHSNGFQDISFTYTQTRKPDIHTGIKKHNARLSYVQGKSAVNDYWDGIWKYYRETSQMGGTRYYYQNSFGGRFWSNQKSTPVVLQHYLEESLNFGIIVTQRAGGFIRAGPLIGTRQRIDPHARHNTDSYDNPVYKNPWSNVFYGLEAHADAHLDPATTITAFISYKNFVNYNDNTGTEMINLDIEVIHQWTPRINAVAEIQYAQNVNDLKNSRLSNNIFNILLKLEYLFDLVL